jgi:hypothetical protein
MPARKNPITDAEQSRRFIQGAKELGTDTPESEAVFERSLKRIAKAKPKQDEPGKAG